MALYNDELMTTDASAMSLTFRLTTHITLIHITPATFHLLSLLVHITMHFPLPLRPFAFIVHPATDAISFLPRVLSFSRPLQSSHKLLAQPFSTPAPSCNGSFCRKFCLYFFSCLPRLLFRWILFPPSGWVFGVSSLSSPLRLSTV